METSHHTPFQSFVVALKQHWRDMWKNLVDIFNPMLAKSHIKSFLRGTDQERKPTGKNEEKKRKRCGLYDYTNSGFRTGWMGSTCEWVDV